METKQNKNLKSTLYLYIKLNRSYLQKLTVWHFPLYVAFSSNKLHRKYTVQLTMHNFTNFNLISYNLARMTLSFPTNCFISHYFINLHIFKNLGTLPHTIYLCMKCETPSDYNRNWEMSGKLVIKQTSCSYLCCKLKSHFISFSLQCSAVWSIKHKLRRRTLKLWISTKLEHCSYFSNLLIRKGVYLSCSHCMWSVTIFLM